MSLPKLSCAPCAFGRRWLGVLTLVLVLGAGPVFAAGPLQVQVLENAADRIVLDYDLTGFGQQAVTIDGEKHSLITLGRESVLQVAGAPALPHVCRSVIVPDDAEMAVRVVASKYYDVADVLVAPSKGTILRTQNPDDVPWTFGDVYDTDAFYPGPLATLHDPYILRDHRGVVVEVCPLQYNPVTQTLRVYTDITVEVVAIGPGQVNVLDRGLRGDELSYAFHQIYSHHFLNYDPGLRYVPLDETGDMLIICYDAWLTNVQPLVDHKNSIGIDTTAVGVSTIGNNATSIKNYIQTVYNGGDLAFVLLVGDAGEIATPSSAGGSADPTYSLLAGSDHYPDVLIGRFSAQSAAQVDTQVLRTIEYELMPATTQAWFKRGVGIASEEGSGIGDDGEADYEHMDNIRTDLLGYGYDPVDRIYATTGGTAAQVSAAVNAGRGIINYCGHGSITAWSTTGFSNTHVDALVNDNVLPFIFSVACVNGQFDGYTCFAEAWLRSTNGTEPTGAVGMYASSINQSWAPPMCAQDESIDLLVAETYFSFGALCFAGSCQMIDEYSTDGQNMFDTWHVFGDPSVRVYGTATQPTGIKVTPSMGLESSGPRLGPFTPESIDYTVENLNDTPLDYSVTHTEPWVSVTNPSGTLPPHGTVVVMVYLTSVAEILGNGFYEDTVWFTNLTDGEGDTSRSVTLEVGVPELVYGFPMNVNPNWTVSGLWAFGQPTGGGGQYGGPDPASGHTGTNVYGYNLSGDYENSLPERHLTTTALDCTGLTEVTLKFWRWLGVEQSTYDHAYVRVSNDGTNWTTVWSNSSVVSDTSWVQQEFDISAVADDQPTVYIRWTMGTTDGSWRYCGWNIDDVEIWGLASSGPAGTIAAVRSCLPHGTAGDLCLDLGTVDIEPRFDGVQLMEFDVTEPALLVGANVDCAPTAYTGTWTTMAYGTTLVTVAFDPPLPDQNCCTVTLTNDVQDSVTVRTLAGDANGDGETNAVDNSQRRLWFGESADVSGAEWDTNCSGAVDAVDNSQTRLRFGHTAAACP